MLAIVLVGRLRHLALAEYLRSGGATPLASVAEGSRVLISSAVCSPMPWNTVLPPGGASAPASVAEAASALGLGAASAACGVAVGTASRTTCVLAMSNAVVMVAVGKVVTVAVAMGPSG